MELDSIQDCMAELAAGRMIVVVDDVTEKPNAGYGAGVGSPGWYAHLFEQPAEKVGAIPVASSKQPSLSRSHS